MLFTLYCNTICICNTVCISCQLTQVKNPTPKVLKRKNMTFYISENQNLLSQADADWSKLIHPQFFKKNFFKLFYFCWCLSDNRWNLICPSALQPWDRRAIKMGTFRGVSQIGKTLPMSFEIFSLCGCSFYANKTTICGRGG